LEHPENQRKKLHTLVWSKQKVFLIIDILILITQMLINLKSLFKNMMPRHPRREEDFPTYFPRLNGESNEIQDECKKRGITTQKFLEEKIGNYQQQLLKNSGQLISALVRGYDFHSLPHQILFFGKITPQTYFGELQEEKSPKDLGFSLLSNIKNPYFCEGNILDSKQKLQIYNQDEYGIGNFDLICSDLNMTPLELLAFVDRPPVYHEPDNSGDCIVLSFDVFSLGKKQKRLELSIGNTEVISVLQKNLSSDNYLDAATFFNLPISSEIISGLQNSRLEVYNKINTLLGRIGNLEIEKKRYQSRENQRLLEWGFTREANELCESKQTLSYLARQVRERRYHEIAIEPLKQEKFPGDIQIIDFHVFFKAFLDKYDQDMIKK
jgi:hypothetical protein